ncbi:hypothetical protein [Chitinophaga agrisoli]|uniref:hypothetical protein n=1 Tax=Chitinophaga agrisoli TaxID=2607653 RepID=UPI0016621106|nr:hypothetical protein [Chitinophaga agrisoli]
MKHVNLRIRPRKWILAILFLAGTGLSILGIPGEPTAIRPGETREMALRREAESKAAFESAYHVFMSPRCMNCHPAGNVPLQGDDSHLHTQGVRRGPDGRGLYALKCKNCHQDANLPGEHMPPGLPTWRLPPEDRPMVFQGKSPRELAASFKNARFTGFASIHQIIEHVEKDPLVLHSFTYGTRPPLEHGEFAAKVREWVEKGAVLPDK